MFLQGVSLLTNYSITALFKWLNTMSYRSVIVIVQRVQGSDFRLAALNPGHASRRSLLLSHTRRATSLLDKTRCAARRCILLHTKNTM